ELFDQLEISPRGAGTARPVHFGGPVETGHGFVLHTTDYQEEATLRVEGNIAVTATLEILRAIGRGQGPRQSLLALGYAGWGPGQLDAEIQANGWLSVAADDAIVFDADHDGKWQRALAKLGIDLSMLSTEAGRA
ncbi:MAG TPA: YqgE/AlgH family protein, partial [Stellaceae bacterium]|nr:YqgE/AlgH family protein [Stellaceae bacterium]